MDIEHRTSLGIGYYYEKDNKVIYIPIEKGKIVEQCLKNDESITQWWRVDYVLF